MPAEGSKSGSQVIWSTTALLQQRGTDQITPLRCQAARSKRYTIYGATKM